jgi:transposase
MNRWNILAEVALHVSQKFDVSLSKVHYDPTSFHFTGEYNNQCESASLIPEIRPFRIEVGRHALPGEHIKEAQVGVNLAEDGKGPVPFFYHSADGKDNGHGAVAKNLQNLLKYVKPKYLLMVTDRGCFSAGLAVQLVRKHKFHFISSVTWKEEYANLYDMKKPKMQEASFLSLKEKRKRESGLPEDTWERYFIGEIPYQISHENQSIRARLIFVRSTADIKVCQKTREKYTAKILKGLEQIKTTVENGRTTEVRKVHKKVSDLYGKKQAQKYFTCNVESIESEEIKTLAPRRKGQRKPKLKFSFRYDVKLAEKDASYDGLYGLATSLPKKTHTTDDVFTAFKEQHHIETAHHQWKAPIRLRPLFLKRVKRLESLIFVQFLALMAFYLIQRLYRLAKAESCKTTAETLIRHFAFCPIAFRYEKSFTQVVPSALSPVQADVLKTLGFPSVDEQIQKYVIPQVKEPGEKN